MLDEFDRLLDESLKSYIAAPQRTGLEERVLIRVTNPHRQKVRWCLSAFAVAALFAGLMVALWPGAQPRQVQTKQHARGDVPRPAPVFEESVQTRSPRTSSMRAAATVLAVKPRTQRVRLLRAREPLTAQERALLQIVVAQPEQLARLSKAMELITVPVIEIKPLSEGKN